MARAFLLTMVAVALLLAPRTSFAQGRAGGVELGFDAGFEFSNVEDIDVGDGPEQESGDAVNIGIPIQRFRVGYHASELISIEPSIGLDYSKVEDPRDDTDERDLSSTELVFGLGILIHLRADPDNPVAYALARGTYNLLNVEIGGDEDTPGEGDETLTQLGAAAGIGVKLPVADRLDVRLEGVYERRFENEDDVLPNSNNYQLNIGFSWYTGQQ
jgi:opacity protein-like surface antigen